MAYEKGQNTPSLTVVHGKSTTVLEMEHKVIDFITLCSTPWVTGEYTKKYFIILCSTPCGEDTKKFKNFIDV